MAEKLHMVNKGPFNAAVKANRQVGKRFNKLTLCFSDSGGKAFAKIVPGQFAQIDLSRTALPPKEAIPEELADSSRRDILLRRPFSFCDVIVDGDETIVEVLYCVVGPATLRMTTLKEGDAVSVIGPLGNGFSVPADKRLAILASGGMGAPPLQHLANVLVKEYPEIKVVAIAGAKSKEEIPFDPKRFSKCEFESIITTDDGSEGLSGFVTEHLESYLDEYKQPEKEIVIYGCGPEVMLAKVARIANSRDIDCQVSMERRMACGTGLCQGCAVECRVEASKESIYKMCCTDGPVFDSKEIVFSL